MPLVWRRGHEGRPDLSFLNRFLISAAVFLLTFALGHSSVTLRLRMDLAFLIIYGVAFLLALLMSGTVRSVVAAVYLGFGLSGLIWVAWI